MLKTGYSLGLIKPIEHMFKPGLGCPNFASLIQINPNKEDNKEVFRIGRLDLEKRSGLGRKVQIWEDVQI